VFQNDSVSTGANARLEIMFVDNTRVTFGERVKASLDCYVVNPARGLKRSGSGLPVRSNSCQGDYPSPQHLTSAW
jgi:hypothetical protein